MINVIMIVAVIVIVAMRFLVLSCGMIEKDSRTPHALWGGVTFIYSHKAIGTFTIRPPIYIHIYHPPPAVVVGGSQTHRLD